MADRVVIFIDAQNMYQGARRAFFNAREHYVQGQFRPDALGQLVVSKGPPGTSRTLEQIRIYSGRPDATRDPKGYAAHMRQCAAWQSVGAVVIARTLRYPPTWPGDKAYEKGIDVALAVDFVSMAIDDEYDVGIVCSVDTDLIPALEYVARKSGLRKTMEVAAWRSEKARGRLAMHGQSIWCHWLDLATYHAITDPTDYVPRV